MADKKDIESIRNIENKYGLVAFRMGLTHIFDVGHRHMDDKAVAEGVKQIIARGLEDNANGKISVMTPEFQIDILRCAAELAQFSIWTLFAYIKNHMEVKL
jgi:hypothetical protein